MSNSLTVIQPWFNEGLRFKCTGCGKCCTGSPGYVWVTIEEIEAIAQELKISFDECVKKYIRKVDNRYSLIEHHETFDCVFLKDKKCTIYSARPTQCRTYPWWFQNVENEQAWKAQAAYCEGINHPEGTLYSCETILEHL